MSFLNIMITLVIGILTLIVGEITKKKWLSLISIIPLGISLIQIIMLFMI